MDFKYKDKYLINDLIDILSILRSDEGCPWDRKQDHKSIKRNFIEETYEAVEAIDNEDNVLLLEELGDVLLQVAFHSQIEKENGGFDFDDVCDGICKKLILRHPHVFSDVKADSTEEVLKNWEEIKMKSKNQSTQSEAMESVCKCLPALIRSEKVQKKASKVGFDWKNSKLALSKVYEEADEVSDSITSKDYDNQLEEIGDLLFSVVNVSRLLKIDPEEALNRACDKFINRFKNVEKLANDKGINMESASLDELDNLWDNVKEDLYKNNMEELK